MQGTMLAKGSVIWILIPLIVMVVFIILYIIPAVILFLVIAVFFTIFFRDPKRKTQKGIVAPADGKITQITRESECVKIVTVMNLHNVHVNRAPVSGKVTKIEHHTGAHVPAFNKDSEKNERMEITMDTQIGKVKMIQIAGAFARRIKPYIRYGDEISKGQRIGIIRFGSRVDLFLPENKVKVIVSEGDKVKAAESQIASEVSHEDR
jgi:phosphatidylserine decarboxylase